MKIAFAGVAAFNLCWGAYMTASYGLEVMSVLNLLMGGYMVYILMNWRL